MFWALTRVPWRTIIMHAPTIVDTARRLYANSRQTDGTGTPDHRPLRGDEVHRVVARLDERAIEQAALTADLARQVQQMTTALEVLRSRLVLAALGSGLGLAIALIALIVALTR